MTVMKSISDVRGTHPVRAPAAAGELLSTVTFLEKFGDELQDSLELFAPSPHYRMVLHLLRGHLEGHATMRRGADREAGIPQNEAHQLGHVRFVVADEDRMRHAALSQQVLTTGHRKDRRFE